jgi:hypothetical protein
VSNGTETNDGPTTSKPNASHSVIDDAVEPVCSDDEDWGSENPADDSDDDPDFNIFNPTGKRRHSSLSVSPSSSSPSRKSARQRKRNRRFDEEEEEEEEGKRR